MRRLSAIAVIVVVCVSAQAQSIREQWSKPFEPFHVIGNVYYVGASGISAHIIATSDGLILIDTGTVEMVPQIKANIEALGFSVEDVKYILSSHAHWDHVEGHAAMKEITGARIVALGEDAVAISSGVDNSALGSLGWTPAEVDRAIEDGDKVALGGVTLTAHLTAGHTKGCTAWTMTVEDDGKSYNVIFVGGTSVNIGVRLLENERHPGIAEDYARTFQVLESLEVDVLLAQHPSMYGMAEKAQRKKNGVDKNPFIDPEEYRAFVKDQRQKYELQLARERSRNRR